MTAMEVLQELETLGTAQNRKIYRRHGAGENLYGVSYANLGKLHKQIKVDQAIAQKLWATGNHDARLLATMIADPKLMSEELVDQWTKDLDNHMVADSFAGLVSQTSLAQPKMEQWIPAENEQIARAGWQLLLHFANKEPDLPDVFFEPYLDIIGRDIHTSKNRVKQSMNSALISIGVRNSSLEQKALAMARQIGKVEVDHGETDCKTPDAAQYIQKTLDYRAKKALART